MSRMPSTNRRLVLALGVGLLAGTLAGCGSVRRRGVKHTLYVDPDDGEKVGGEEPLHLDNLSPGERDVVDSAIENGEYTEGYVDWVDVPNGTTISEPFKSIILRLANHERSTAEKELGTPRVSDIEVETLTRYDGALYATRVTSESAE